MRQFKTLAAALCALALGSCSGDQLDAALQYADDAVQYANKALDARDRACSLARGNLSDLPGVDKVQTLCDVGASADHVLDALEDCKAAVEAGRDK